ncbi:hypothetical protein GOV07_01320, partial [Candidatus Woesearchaeota archaeon]|nr:hypothetical protein [Candidatus Woesearchaeota archaeon]
TYEECDGTAGVPPDGDYSCAANCTLEYTPICEDLDYLGPYAQSNVSQWMDTVSRIAITDGGEELCNGTGHTFYKNTWLQGEDELYCAGDCDQWTITGYNTSGWETYQGPFSGGNESCHVIEYYNEDANGNRTPIQWDCVYMDKTAPELEKTVGEPKSAMSQRNKELGAAFYPELLTGACDEEGACWDITLLTPIDMTCTDAEPHPSGVVDLCFNVDFDNEDVTEEYCNGTNGEMRGGDCCIEDDNINFHFTKISWHKLSYYCIDAVNKTSEPDIEYFKVEETSFDIQLNKKWNLISVPVKLLDDSMDEVFAGLEDVVASVWQYDGENWHIYTPDNISNDDLTTMVPGYGYWVLTTEAATLTIGGSLFNPAVIAPEIPITHGWNLVGYYGAENQSSYDGPDGAGKTAECLFSSFGDSIFDKGFTSVYGYWELFNPNMWTSYGRQDSLDPGAGYWVFATEDAIYAPPPADCS